MNQCVLKKILRKNRNVFYGVMKRRVWTNAKENRKDFDKAMSLKENAIKIKMFLMKSWVCLKWKWEGVRKVLDGVAKWWVWQCCEAVRKVLMEWRRDESDKARENWKVFMNRFQNLKYIIYLYK